MRKLNRFQTEVALLICVLAFFLACQFLRIPRTFASAASRAVVASLRAALPLPVPDPPAGPTLESIVISTGNLSVITTGSFSMVLGSTVRFYATGFYTDGTSLDITSSVTWASSQPGVASIGANTGIALGLAQSPTTNITATLNGVTSPAITLTVYGGELQQLVVAPYPAAVAAGSTYQMYAFGLYSVTGGLNPKIAENISDLVTWSSDDTTVATVDVHGVVTAHGAPNSATLIHATAPGFTSFASLQIVSATPGWTATGSLPTVGFNQTATLMNNGQALFAGGTGVGGNNLIVSNASLYNPASGKFSQTASLTIPRLGHTATLLQDGSVLITGGTTTSSAGQVVTNTAEIYYPDVGTFAPTVGPMTSPRVDHTATLLSSGKVLIAGGLSGSSTASVLATAELYDPVTGTFTATNGNPIVARELHTATLLQNGQVLIAGGRTSVNGNGSSLNSAELFNPATGLFSPTLGNLPVPTDGHTATLLTDGRVLIAGGGSTQNGLNSTSAIYDPVSENFSSIPGPNDLRDFQSAAMLQNGMVLLAGGQGLSTDTLQSAELFDPVCNSFSFTGNMSTARTEFTLITLPNGSVLAAGGLGLDNFLGTAEIYSPAAQISPNLLSLAVTPNGPSIGVGELQQFTAMSTCSNNVTQNVTSNVSWSSTNAGVAQIGVADGLAAALSTGTTQIAAQVGAIKSPAQTLTVTPAPDLVSIAVTPANPTIPMGTTEQFTATGTYSNSTTQDITSSVTWVSDSHSTATIDVTGLAFAAGSGTAHITASLAGVTSPADTLTVTAVQPTLLSIAITPASPSVFINNTVQLTATGSYSDTTTKNITTGVTWLSSNTSVATIGPSTGVATGVTPGTTQITASLGGIAAPPVNLQVTLTIPQSGLVTVTPGQISTIAGMTYSGNQVSSGDGGPATSAEFSTPEGIALDANGNLYIVDFGNNVIRFVNRQSTAVTILGQTVQPGDIQTVIGNSSNSQAFSGDGGPAGQATLEFPQGVLVDPKGNIYVADSGNDRVRVVNMQSTDITVFGVTIHPGDINTVAGSTSGTGCAGATDQFGDGCPATTAAFDSPEGMALDGVGNLYIADYADGLIREVVAATNQVKLVAGSTTLPRFQYSGDGGPPQNAQIFDPMDVKVDLSGNVYIADTENERIRVVNRQSVPITIYGVTIYPNTIQTVVGSGTTQNVGDGGPAYLAGLDLPSGIWLDPAGDLFIADNTHSTIRFVSSSTGIITTIAGGVVAGYSGDGGPATSAELRGPLYITVDTQGNVVFSEESNRVIRQISGGTGDLTFGSTYVNASAPTQIIALRNLGNASVTFSSIGLGGTNLSSFGEATTCGSTLTAGASCAISVTFTPQATGPLTANVNILESNGSSQTVNLNGTGIVLTTAKLTVSSPSLSFGNQAVGTTSNQLSFQLSNIGAAAFTPSSILVLGTNSGYFASTNNCSPSVPVGQNCTVDVTFSPGTSGPQSAFVVISGNAINAPIEITLGGTGTISGGSGSSPSPPLQVIPGVVNTIAGNGTGAGNSIGGGYTGDGGPAVAAELSGPFGLAEDSSGNVYFPDSNNNVIRVVNMQATPITVLGVTIQPGDIQTVIGTGYGAGTGAGGFTGDGGPPLLARLSFPTYVAFDKSGNLFISDYDNNAIRVVNTQSTAISVAGVTIQPNTIQTIAGRATTVCAQSTDTVGDGCPPLQAKAGTPYQLQFDSNGNLFFSDQNQEYIRAINLGTSPITVGGVTIAPNTIQAVAGNGTQGFSGDGGPATQAAFDAPYGMALDTAGNIYIADTFNFRIRLVNTQPTPIAAFGVTVQPGDIETIMGNGAYGYAGDGGPARYALAKPTAGLNFDSAGNLYFGDIYNNVVREIFKSTGIIQTVAGNGFGGGNIVNGKLVYTGGYTGDGGPATSAEFFGPFAMTIDAFGNTTITDAVNQVIRQVSASPAPVSFPNTVVGSSSGPQMLTYSNISNQTITFTGLTISPNFKQVPSGNTDCTASISLPPAGLCYVDLEFSPTATGLLTGTFQTTNNAGLQTAQLSGTGIAAGGVTLQSIAITPSSPTINRGETQQFVATGTYSDSSTQDLSKSVDWSSSNLSAATIVASNGLATGIAGGTTNITASLGSVTSSPDVLTVTSNGPALTSISVTPSNPSIAKGLTQQFIATGTYADGTSQVLTNSVTWASSVTSVATITTTGLATGVGTSTTTTISAMLSGVTGQTVLTVTPATLVSIAITPANFTMPMNSTKQLTATGTFTDGSTMDLTSTVTWNSAIGYVAVIEPGGLAISSVVTGEPNTTAVTATLNGITGTTNLSVAPVTVTSITVTPGNPSISPGATQQFVATGTYTDGSKQDISNIATWTSSAFTIATVSSTGLATAVKPSTATISAALNGVTGSTVLTVTGTAPTLVSIAVTPANPSIAKGASLQFTATGTYSDNSTQNITTTVTWASQTLSVATFGVTPGLATAVGVGTSQITASLSGVTSPGDTLTVTPPNLVSIAVTPQNPSIVKGDTQQFTATGTYTDNSTQDLTATVTWNSQTQSVATFGTPNGFATGVGVGTSQITAAISGITSPADTLTVTAPPLVSIAVAPTNPSIAKGTTQQFTAMGTYSDNSKQDITATVTWASATQSVATFGSPNGLATGVGTGTSLITAALSGITSPGDTLTVTGPTLVSIALTPTNPSISKGLTQQFTATGTYTDNSTQNVTSSVTWASATQSVATFGAPNGLATGVGTGTSLITAALNGITSPSDTLTVTAATLVSIAVTPANPSIAKGATQQFTATGTYSDSSTQNITTTVTWASATQAVATFGTPNGLATGVGAGTSLITAALSGVTSPSETLTVTGPALLSIAVTPANPSIAKGLTQQFTATGTYTDNSTQNITTSVTWNSATTSVATIVTSTGLATGVGTGTSLVTAALNGITSPGDTLTVTAAVLESIAVTPANPTILVNGSEPFTATGTYSDNSTQNLTASATWASATTSVATIGTTTGVALGVTAGTSQITAAVGAVKSPSDTLAVDNPLPAIGSLLPAHSAGGTAFTLTVNGTNFVSTSTVSFNGKTETTTNVSGTQLTAAILAGDVSTGGNVNVTVTSPTPGGGTSTAVTFTVDDFSVAGPGSTVDVTPGQPTPVSIMVTPSANGFANAVQVSVSGLPTGMTAQFSQDPVTPGTTVAKLTLTVTATAPAKAQSSPPGSRFPTGPAGLIASILAAGMLIARRWKMWGNMLPARAGLVLWLIVLCGLGVSLSGCNAGFPLGNNPTPPGNYSITVSGASGTVQHSTTVMLSVE